MHERRQRKRGRQVEGGKRRRTEQRGCLVDAAHDLVAVVECPPRLAYAIALLPRALECRAVRIMPHTRPVRLADITTTRFAQERYHSVLEGALVDVAAAQTDAAFVVKETEAPLTLVRVNDAVRAAVVGPMLVELMRHSQRLLAGRCTRPLWKFPE